ncbi:hypothetical protein F1D05_10215 [Kribbella qitaiheensis]|uniref:Uncharacterized protein n=1 Tax=Kribbella qitaiheensis TaxID=1544730 RepID=A0A7G6WW36_9ACTN|nr:hypothetical protein [Kribbella qitaiheensis]QNE18201.1 hypothetical protein F1D05_10215 [Kribbella qitaiheensis]
MKLRRFLLIRYVDVSKVSGTGVVAQGVLFSDGAVAVRWPSATPCTMTWDRLDDLLAVHGHGGSTVVHWIDETDPVVPEFQLAGTGAGR